MFDDIKNKVKKEVIKSLIGKYAVPLIIAIIGIFFIVLLIVIILSADEFEDFGAIETRMTNAGYGRGIVGDYDIDPDSDQGQFHARVESAAIDARVNANIRIHTGIIGATFYYINSYYDDFEYNDMTDKVINNLIYNMVKSQTTLQCRGESSSAPIDMPDNVVRCYQIISTERDPEGNPVTPAEITTCNEIINDYKRSRGNDSGSTADERMLTFNEGETPSCPANYDEVSRTISYSLSWPKYYDYLTNTFIPTVAPDLTDQEILEIIDEIKTIEERYLESEGVPDYILSIDIGYVPPDIAEEFSAPFKIPYKITSWFGLRLHPTKGTYHFHSGIDISGSNKYGTLNKKPIYAPASGVVATVGRDKSCGNKVILRHTIKGKVYETVYCHLYEIHVSVGSESNPKYIEKGEPIGLVGTTGDSTGPHLHWGVWEGRYGRGIRLDPFEFIKNDPNCYYGNSNNPTPCSSK
jgi:murein DD-endopeptidase MepM/ murein hydrolase activator NlpD